MKVIIEGVDGVGKTTLAKHIAKMFDLEYNHDSCPRDFKAYKEELLNHKNRVYDRFFFGQFAGYQTKSETLLSKKELKKLINIAKDNGVIILLCYDSIDSIVKRFKNNGDDIKWMIKTGFNSVTDFVTHIQNGFLEIAKVGGAYINYIDMSKVKYL